VSSHFNQGDQLNTYSVPDAESRVKQNDDLLDKNFSSAVFDDEHNDCSDALMPKLRADVLIQSIELRDDRIDYHNAHRRREVTELHEGRGYVHYGYKSLEDYAMNRLGKSKQWGYDQVKVTEIEREMIEEGVLTEKDTLTNAVFMTLLRIDRWFRADVLREALKQTKGKKMTKPVIERVAVSMKLLNPIKEKIHDVQITNVLYLPPHSGSLQGQLHASYEVTHEYDGKILKGRGTLPLEQIIKALPESLLMLYAENIKEKRDRK